jgi:hypothetical protein
MISPWLANVVLIASLYVSVRAYIVVSKREGSYINILTPSFIVSVPAYYLLPLVYANWFGTEASSYAYIYVYATLAVESAVFAYFYTRRASVLRLPFAYSYSNFGWLGFAFLALAVLLYLPVLLQFSDYILDPRRIYEQTRTGFGANFYLSSSLAYLAVILILFSKRSSAVKAFVIILCALVLSLHGSKGQVLSLLFLLILFEIYVRGYKLKLMPALIVGAGVATVGVALFAATMALNGPLEALESISEYSDYTRNAMLVIDSNIPRQYGRLTLESNIISLIPRALMPSKPKNFGPMYLDEQFYPESLDEDAGSPAFGVGLQYADFGVFAIGYLALFAAFRGWLAHLFVKRLKLTRHPADFIVVAFLADISLFPIGAGWLLPETIFVAILIRFASCLGADQVYRERVRPKLPPITSHVARGIKRAEGTA